MKIPDFIRPRTRAVASLALLPALFSAARLAASDSSADPQVTSWLTSYSARYARIYTNDAMQAAGDSVTTWSNGTESQNAPAYAGVQEIYSSSNAFYIRTTGLASHVMGPWLNGNFPNLPENKRTFWRFPLVPSVPASKGLTGFGTIGLFVDGVAMYDSRDAFSWNGSSETQGSGYWNRDAFVNEAVSFDPAFAHQDQSGTHHYHASPVAVRYQLGDHVDFNPVTRKAPRKLGGSCELKCVHHDKRSKVM